MWLNNRRLQIDTDDHQYDVINQLAHDVINQLAQNYEQGNTVDER